MLDQHAYILCGEIIGFGRAFFSNVIFWSVNIYKRLGKPKFPTEPNNVHPVCNTMYYDILCMLARQADLCQKSILLNSNQNPRRSLME